MKRYIFPLALLTALMGVQRAYSQCQDVDKDWVCGDVRVDCPEAGGRVVSFIARVSQGVPIAKFTFHWTLSGGKITSGQGTDSISVDTRGLEGKSFIATVEVGGGPKGVREYGIVLNKGQPSTSETTQVTKIISIVSLWDNRGVQSFPPLRQSSVG